jgi:hypothetical protein
MALMGSPPLLPFDDPTEYNEDSERTPPCAHAHARAREKPLKNFRLVPLRRRYVQRCRALAVIIPITSTSEPGSGDDIVDLGAAASLKNERARLEPKPNSIGAEPNKATGQKNSIASALTVKH